MNLRIIVSQFFNESCSNHVIKTARLATQSNRRRANSRRGAVEPLEIRQLLTGDFVSATVTSGNDGSIDMIDVAVDGSGSIYELGSFTGLLVDLDPSTGVFLIGSGGNQAAFIRKTSAEGTFLWAKTLTGGSVSPTALALGDSSNAFVVGNCRGICDLDPGAGVYSVGSPGSSLGFLCELDALGSFRQAGVVSATAGQGTSELTEVVPLADGSLLVGGSASGVVDIDPSPGTQFEGGDLFGFVVHLDSQLGRQNHVLLKPNIVDDFVLTALAVGADGRAYFCYEHQTSINSLPATRLVLGALRPNYDGISWVKSSQSSSTSTHVHSENLLVDGAGDLYVAIDSNNTYQFNGPTFSDPDESGSFSTVVKLTPTGQTEWSRTIDARSVDIRSLAIGPSGSIVATASISGAIDLDPTSGTEFDTGSAAAVDIDERSAVVALTSQGDFRWGRTFATRRIAAAAFLPDARLILVGQFYGTIDLDPGIGTFPANSPNRHAAFSVLLSESVAYTDPGGSDLVLRRNGKYLELFRRHIAFGETLLERHYLASKPAIDILGSNTVSNSLIIDFASGGTFTTAGIRFNGGTDTANNDRVTIIGANFEGATYRPSSGFSEFRVHNQSISLFQSESAIASGLFSLSLETASGTDLLTMSPATGYQSAPATRITGKTAGLSLIPLTFSNIPMVVVDTGLNDLTLATSSDSVTVAAGGLEATGLLNFIVRTGRGNDTLKVTGPDIGLHGTGGTAGGTFTFLAGSGTDRISAIGDTNWQVSDTRLRSLGGGSVLLDDVEKATLTGGNAANTLTALGFTGDLTADGGAGNDLIRGSSGNDYLLGGTGNDRLYGVDGDDQLNGQDGNDSLYGDADEDVLKGEAGNDRLFGGDDDDRLLGEVGDDTLFGGSGNDSLDGGDGNDLLNGESGNDNLIGGVGRDLYEFNGTSNAEDLRLLRSSATSAAFQRKPRGLLSVLERDTVTMDASDEFSLYALGGDDLIAIDSLFTQLGFVDGGDGTDTCTLPTTWSKVSC